ncbi:deazaflavin-dependent oxidoreductase (nitroreductase family) [Amycolatopsis endophytica]|uniref:Deazaflavin-dependent oxidoreductase (Nitroreductase family) n=1 Tax=Amycolatopsis endophytica TaxID=860233 RepID=A0A853AWU8_9PSEU|nr:nitroreductase/quinone reductase family protein [Amycolatopsis endophytica]NYI87076.1 deazaflavin-dependent oxidoreductase (nitroreductase family) [Amycolatopsis endophytica]
MVTPEQKKRRADAFHRAINPVMRMMPGQVVLETTGRRSGLPRQVPVGGKVIDGAFWFVSGDGPRAAYIRNIEANPAVRVRLGSTWRTGTAHLLPEDDPYERLNKLPAFNSMMVRRLGTAPLTVRVDLD